MFFGFQHTKSWASDFFYFYLQIHVLWILPAQIWSERFFVLFYCQFIATIPEIQSIFYFGCDPLEHFRPLAPWLWRKCTISWLANVTCHLLCVCVCENKMLEWKKICLWCKIRCGSIIFLPVNIFTAKIRCGSIIFLHVSLDFFFTCRFFLQVKFLTELGAAIPTN